MEEYDSLDETRWPGPDAGTSASASARPPVAIGGWKKRCIYAAVVLLVCVVALNLTLVLWIMKAVHFNTDGVNYIQMVQNGIQLTRKTYVQDTLVVNRVFTPAALSLQSAHNLSLSTTNRAGRPSSSLLMGNGALEIRTPSFRVTDGRRTLFAVDKDSVSIAAHSIPIVGEGGTSVEGILQTPIISAELRTDLELESRTGAVHAMGIAGLTIESRAGDILANSMGDMSLTTLDGAIKLESSRVLMPTLRHSQSGRRHSRAHQHSHQHPGKHRQRPDRIYQLCICASGQLFLAEADAYCDTGANNELCR